jgi:hypothetical protein
MKRLLLPMLCGAALAGLESDYLGLDTHVANQLVLTAGLPVGILDGEVPLPHPIVGTLTHELDSSWRPGVALGVAWQRTAWNGDGNGWHLEVGLAAERWSGAVTADQSGGVSNPTSADIAVQAGLVTLAIGPTWRWDSVDLRFAPKQWQLDIAPVVGLGAASVAVGGGNDSDLGLVYSLGARVRLTTAIGDGWRIGAQLGAAWSEARVRWSNTDQSTFHGLGPTAGIVLVLGE